MTTLATAPYRDLRIALNATPTLSRPAAYRLAREPERWAGSADPPARLACARAGRGAVVTGFPCGLTPRAWHFPVRNRVIAALAAGTLVVQAAPRSGSLLTARHALDLGREVWAVPGRIFDERSLGPNALIRDGAALVLHPRDILDALDALPSGRTARRAGSGEPARRA